MTLSDARKRTLGHKYDPRNLFFGGYDYGVWSENEEEFTDKEEMTDKEESVNLLTCQH